MSRIVLVLGDALGDIFEEVGDAERASVVERDRGEVRVMGPYELDGLESCAVVFDGAAYLGARVVVPMGSPMIMRSSGSAFIEPTTASSIHL